MRFRFRLDKVMRQREIERDLAQREYQEAQEQVRIQVAKIKKMYGQIDDARDRAENLERQGGAKSPELTQIEEFITGQKILIQAERVKARDLMAVAEEKLEILTAKLQDYKALEKLKDKKFLEFRKQQNKKQDKEQDDITIMRSNSAALAKGKQSGTA